MRVHAVLRAFGVLVSVSSATLTWGVTGAAEGGSPQAQIVWPMPQWSRVKPAAVGMDEAKLVQARDYAVTGGGSGYITRHGRLVMAWGDPRARYDLKSTTKSFGSIATGLAIKDGKLRLEDKAKQLQPALGVPPEENARTGWLDETTILHLASQTAGFEKPGGYTKQLFRPGTQWDYSDSGPNWLAECITLAYHRDVDEWMFERVFTPLGIRRSDLTWRKNSYRPATIDGVARREFGSGIHANVDAMARVGYLMLRDGRWNGREILTKDFARLAPRTPPGHEKLPVRLPETYGNASPHYGLLWWNNADETLDGVPLDAYWSWGLYDSLIVVIPSLDIVVARAGQSWKREQRADHYDVLKPFLVPIVQAVRQDGTLPAPREDRSSRRRATATTMCSCLGERDADYPPSPVIREVLWAPPENILRRAKGGDNWPITWGDDDWLYTAYGDGSGFEPRLKEKLSLGLSRVRGNPPQVVAENLRAPSLEQKGDGARGRKASGLLMVEGVLYLWARNAGNAQLAWSADHGGTWTWADWKLTTSFGCPTLLNFGRDYDGARDESVYIYSHDSDSAYRRADRMVMARVPKDRIREHAAYEFFQSLDSHGQPVWTRDVARRGAVLTNPGRCYRSSVSYNAGLKRYLWVQTGPGEDTRFVGGLAICDAPEPWGPWTTVFTTDAWDVGPGETAGFPTKWMSPDGRTLHLVFSGDDCFSVRRCTLVLDGEETEYRVSTDGDDASSGNRQQPFRSIQHGVQAMQPGDTLLVQAGRYEESVSVAAERSGGPGKRLTICAASGAEWVMLNRLPRGMDSGPFRVRVVDDWIKVGRIRYVPM
ncbi:MAG TPA: serine hydrolase [Thermoguttaceae bacterium]|nr:serine hydrolase [Thermoguttaceae bacterium]